jgi:hypothetical protein
VGPNAGDFSPPQKNSIFCLPFLDKITYKRLQHEFALGTRGKEGPETLPNPRLAAGSGKGTKTHNTKKIFLKKSPPSTTKPKTKRTKPKEKQKI